MSIQGFLVIALLSGVAISQLAFGPNLINNKQLNEALVKNILPKECQNVSKLIASREVENQCLISHKFNTARISVYRAGTHSTNKFVTKALNDAVATPGTVAISEPAESEWNTSSSIKSIGEVVYAVANDKTVDYYHLEFHLNIQGQLQDAQDNYVKALTSYKCNSIKDWIKHYFQ